MLERPWKAFLVNTNISIFSLSLSTGQIAAHLLVKKSFPNTGRRPVSGVVKVLESYEGSDL